MNAPRLWRAVAIGIVTCSVGVGWAWAKLPTPPMDEAAKAKAEEAKAKAADATKKAREAEEKAMDRVADRYKKEKGIKAVAATPADKKK
jgi:hypothetical protein